MQRFSRNSEAGVVVHRPIGWRSPGKVSMIEAHLLRYALAAAESGSFSRAADQFRVKQSTLSKRIRYLEQRLGVSLFTRSTQGVSPTPNGARFLERARSIISELDLLATESFAATRGEIGSLRIGFSGSLSCGELRLLLDEFRREVPDVEIDALEGDRQHLLDALDRARIDVAIVPGDAPESHGQSLSLWGEPVSVAVPIAHPLLDLDRLYWTDLRTMTFVVTSADPGPQLAAIIASRLSGPSLRPRIIRQAVSRESLQSFVGPSTVAVLAGMHRFAGEGIVVRAIHDAFGQTHLEQSIHWRDPNDNPAAHRFLALVARRHGRAWPLRSAQEGRHARGRA